MKLKNSYILLIVMSIFLLISIGSVCANDNTSIDNDIALADDGSDVVLTDDTNEDTTQEKTNTTVVSSDVEVNYGENAIIPVTVNDNESTAIEVDESNLTVTEGNTTIGFSYNNYAINLTEELSAGNHSLIIGYLGNSVYNNSTTTIILSIIGNNTLELPSTVGCDGTSVEIPIKLTDSVNDNTNLLNSNNTQITITYTDGNATKTENVTITDWESVAANNKLEIDVTDMVPATLTVSYTENNKTSSKTVTIKYASYIKINESEISSAENEDINFTVEVLDNNDNPINISKDNLTINGVSDFTFNATSSTVTVSGLDKGTYNLTVIYNGNDLYNVSSENVILNVKGSVEINTNVTSLNVNSTKKGEILINNITNGVDLFNITTETLTISVSYLDGNDTKTINISSFDVEDNNIVFVLEDGNFTNANLTIDYNDGSNNASKTITLKRIYNVEIQLVNTVNEYQDGNFTFKLVDLDDSTTSLEGKTLSLYTVGNIRAGFSGTADANGIVNFKTKNLYEFDNTNSSFTMKQLNVGNHSVELSTSSPIISTKVTTNLTITKATIKIAIGKFSEYYGTDKNVTITVTNANSGEAVASTILHLYMPETSGKNYYFQTDSNGQSKISVKSLVGGTYTVTVSNNDTTNINNVSTTGSITIKPIPVKITTKNVKMYYNSGSTATIKITNKSTGKAVAGVYVLVQFDKNSKKTYLFQTNSKGVITFSASLAIGTHKMTVSTADSRYTGSSVTKTIKVIKAAAKIKAPKVTAYYKGGKYFTIKVTNTKNKKAIYDAKVNIKIYVSSTKYYNYNGNTGSNGKLKLLVDLKPGTYTVVVSNNDKKNYTAKSVTSKIVVKKAPTKLIPKKLTAKKGASKYFKVTVKNKKTKKVIAGVKVKIKVYTGKKYKTYTVKTNSKGIAKLNTKSLKVGTHKVVVSSANKYCVASNAKSTIKITKK